jgi:hypothetical protein
VVICGRGSWFSMRGKGAIG